MTDLMTAAVYERYGPPGVVTLRLEPKPAPKAGEVLVRVEATTVTAADWRVRKADPFMVRMFNGLLRPTKARILGIEFAGQVEAVGQGVTRFAPGDRVFGSAGFTFGAHAEYLVVAESGSIAPIPANLAARDAAGICFGGFSALSNLRLCHVAAGQKVLVVGASGSVGVFAVQLATQLGAEVTGVCGPSNVDLVRGLGAHRVIDYSREDFSRLGPVHDVVIDTVGKNSFGQLLKALKRGGYLGLVAPSFSSLPFAQLAARTGRIRLGRGRAFATPADLAHLVTSIEAGQIRPVIDSVIPFARIAEAHARAEAGHKRGALVVSIP